MTESRHPPVNKDILPEDAGAAFVLQSKGEWWHAGFHLTTAIVGPTILTLPYAFRGLGWGLGVFCLTTMAVVTFYSYYLMCLVLKHCENAGHRHIRFRELAAYVLVGKTRAIDRNSNPASTSIVAASCEIPNFSSDLSVNSLRGLEMAGENLVVNTEHGCDL